MNPDALALVREIQSTIAIIGAIVGLLGSAAGTVIGTKIGQRWLEKEQTQLRGWVSDLNHQITDHERRISTVEGVCEARRDIGKC